MPNPNSDKLKYIGLNVWHDMGYDGALGITATGEKPVINDLTRDWWTTPLTGIEEGSEHSLKTALTFHQFAPKRKLIYLPGSLVKNEQNLYFNVQSFPYILKNGVDSMFCSFSHDPDGMDNYLSKLPYLFYANSAGNGGDKTYDPAPRAEFIYGVGSYNLAMDMPNASSSKSPYVDFSMPDNIYIPATNGAWYPFNGTSCAAPALAGVVACVNHFFILKTGKPLLKEKMYQFLKDNSKDVWTKGKDDKTGWGIPILPHPNTVDIEKYATEGGEEKMNFTDIKGHWGFPAIVYATDQQYMHGYPDGTFRPDKPVTRAELAQILYNKDQKEGKENE